MGDLFDVALLLVPDGLVSICWDFQHNRLDGLQSMASQRENIQ